MPKVLIADGLSSAALQIFAGRGVAVDNRKNTSADELLQLIPDYDALVVRSASRVTPAVLDAARKMKVVGRAGIGVDNIDVAAATARGVMVMNTPFGNNITTAEHTVSLMMALARQIPEANASTHAGKWEKSKFMGVELYGKTLGLIGCGNIGGIVADRAQGLKMKVIAYDPFLSAERAEQLGVEKIDLDQLLARADFISLHVPLTEQTKNILDAAALAKCQKGVRIINCARGGLVVEADLKAALDAGHVAGAALDVFAEEPAKNNILFGDPRVVCTPHLGAATVEAQENVALQIAEQISDFLLVGAVSNALNMPNVSAEDAPRLKPYMKLADHLGSLAGQMAAANGQGAIREISLGYIGHVAALNIKPLSSIMLKGALGQGMESINMVNAPHMAKERNIKVTDTRTDKTTDYQTLVSVTLQQASGTLSVQGTLASNGDARLVGLNGIRCEAELTPRMLLISNHDKPGFIGRLGTLLGNAGINIANFTLGRDHEGGKALALVAVDQPVDDALVTDIRKLDGVVSATALMF